MKKPKLKIDTIDCPVCTAKVDIDYGCCGRQWCSVCGTEIFIDYYEDGAICRMRCDICDVWKKFGEEFKKEGKKQK